MEVIAYLRIPSNYSQIIVCSAELNPGYCRCQYYPKRLCAEDILSRKPKVVGIYRLIMKQVVITLEQVVFKV